MSDNVVNFPERVPPPADTAMHRQLFVEMTPEQQEEFLDGIRQRRLRPVQVYEELQRSKRNAKDNVTRTALQKQASMMDKELIALDKALEKVEARATKVRALQTLLNASSIGDSGEDDAELPNEDILED